MLRPATPLSILLFAAFALLLISILSTPIIKSIPLASFGGVDFGVFGFCQGTKCSRIEIGYSTASLFDSAQADTFDLPTATRSTLSAILVIHPVAAFFTLVMLILAITAHFHSPSHSPRYLLGIFILSILTLLLALLAFLIDVLLFVPHMSWGSYIVLAATILIGASGIVSCAMRRTLVSRKARQRRIAENAEMNGENFYNRQQVVAPLVPAVTGNSMANTPVGAEKLPAFATYEVPKSATSDRISDERVPLTARSLGDNSPNNIPLNGAIGANERIGGPQRMGSPRDQYGNPLPRQPPPNAYGMQRRDGSAGPPLNRQYSDPAMNSRGRGGMAPGGYRGGRGGYPNGGRGGYGGPGPRGYAPPRGGYGRGGFSGPYRGGVSDGAMPMGAGMRGRGGPPPGYGPPTGQYGNGYGRPGPEGYRNVSPIQQGPTIPYVAYNAGDNGARDSLPRAESPPPLSDIGPVGQAVEMDATTGSPSSAPSGFGQFGNLRDSDGDVAGMVGLQQQKMQRHESETSRYSSDEPYVPPRSAWGTAGRSSPLNPVPAVELPNPTPPPGHNRESSDNYFEDVDPRFADPVPLATNSLVPSALAPGRPNNNSNNLQPLSIGGLDGNNSFNSLEDLQSGSRSPAESDRSNFTSVSQRGINPRWPGPNGYGAPMPVRRPVPQQRTDLLLNANPDFELPGGRGRAGVGMGRGLRGNTPNSAYPG